MMRPTHRLPSLALIAIALVSGCQVVQRHRPVVVEVRDMETKRPIPNAEVHVCEKVGSTNYHQGMTGQDGIIRLRTAVVGEEPISVEAVAAGYLDESTYIPIRTVRTIEPASLFQNDAARPVSLVVEMYAKPLPTVELILPAGYHGEVKAEVHSGPNFAWPAGQRELHYAVSPVGNVEVRGPELLRRLNPTGYVLQYADGVPLSRGATNSAVGFWWLKHDENGDHYFVGTPGEYALHHSGDIADEIIQKASGGKSDGGGHRGGGGHRHGGGGGSQGMQ